MDLNSITYLLIAALMVYIVYSRVKLYYDHTVSLQNISKKQKFKIYRSFSWFYVVYGLVIVASIGAAIFTYIGTADDKTMWYLVYVVLAITSATDLLRTYMINTTYYNEDGFFNTANYVRYKSVRSFKPGKFNLSTEVLLFSGETIIMPTNALQFLEDRMIKARK